jgi:hypothetical protein
MQMWLYAAGRGGVGEDMLDESLMLELLPAA